MVLHMMVTHVTKYDEGMKLVTWWSHDYIIQRENCRRF